MHRHATLRLHGFGLLDEEMEADRLNPDDGGDLRSRGQYSPTETERAGDVTGGMGVRIVTSSKAFSAIATWARA